MDLELNGQAEALDQISIVPFKFKYFKDLIYLLETQRYPHIEEIKYKRLPKTGYIAFVDNLPIAVGFLRKMEGNIAQIDGLTTHAFAGAILRNDGINAVVDALVTEAKRLKLDGLIATTEDKNILNRALERGFKIAPVTTFVLKLK